ncbi:hypothetical protein HHI36_016702 [Cryptolaemus montrouzieri]|uniref:TROVE domain-containing protein n=1 Tax=Cryptolaemus montrouzieri TaxID=559131 RepID=A0ABD2NKQ6_9CUCU
MSTITDRTRLRRLLYLTDVDSRYTAGNPEDYFLKDFNTKLDFMLNVLSKQENIFIDILKEANDDELLPRRVTLFYVLAFALSRTESHSSNLTRNALALTAVHISKSDEEFFKFVSIYTKLNRFNSKNKITTAVGRAFNLLLENKTPLEYAQAVSQRKGYHGWKYKDLIKLSHYKSKSKEKTLITYYVFFGMKEFEDQDLTDMKEIHEILVKWETLKKTEDEAQATSLVKQLHANFSHVNTDFVKSQEVWSAIISELPLLELLRLLPKFHRLGLLKANSSVHNKVVKELSSLERIRESKIDPMAVFICMKDFEKGGKPIDPKLEVYLKSNKDTIPDFQEKINKFRSEPKCPIISCAIGKCLKFSYPSDPFSLGTGKRILLALDVTSNPGAVCFKNRNITCLEAELALSLYYLKTEKNINVAKFSDEDVEGLELDKNASFAENLQMLKNCESEYLRVRAVFDWALENNKTVDVFICFVQTFQSMHSVPKSMRTRGWNSIKDGLAKYQKKKPHPSAKFVLICLGSHNIPSFIDVSNTLTICGFSPEIPKVIKAFVTGSFK